MDNPPDAADLPAPADLPEVAEVSDTANLPDVSEPHADEEPTTADAASPMPGDAMSRTERRDIAAPSGRSSLIGHLALYTFLRLALVAALTAVLMIFMPLIVALLFAIIVQLPLAWVLFAGPRRRVNQAMAQASRRRRDERSRLQAALRGDDAEN